MTIKEAVLQALEQSRGTTVSGQALSATLGVSRNAIWKAVNALKGEGHEIASSTKLGYSLSKASDVLTVGSIRAALPLERQDTDIILLDETGSTNNEAKRLISGGITGYTLVVAKHQSTGKGRLGRSFFSPKGGIYMSLAFKTDAEITDAVRLTTAASVAVALAIEARTAQRPLIKWVNDVYLDGKKICGILTEGVADIESGRVRHIVIGIGLNCGDEPFPEELREIACSLPMAGVSRGGLIAEIAANLMDFVEGRRAFMADYRKRSLVIGKEINYFKNGEATPALAEAIDDSGALLVRHEDGSTARLSTGEISVRLR